VSFDVKYSDCTDSTSTYGVTCSGTFQAVTGTTAQDAAQSMSASEKQYQQLYGASALLGVAAIAYLVVARKRRVAQINLAEEEPHTSDNKCDDDEATGHFEMMQDGVVRV
jgi:hypothetical protein